MTTVEANGVTVIPAARVMGGAGGGNGEGPNGTAQGEGAGFGLMARPVQPSLHYETEAVVIVHDEDAHRTAVRVELLIVAHRWAGSSKTTVVPLPTPGLVIMIFPPCCSIMA